MSVSFSNLALLANAHRENPHRSSEGPVNLLEPENFNRAMLDVVGRDGFFGSPMRAGWSPAMMELPLTPEQLAEREVQMLAETPVHSVLYRSGKIVAGVLSDGRVIGELVSIGRSPGPDALTPFDEIAAEMRSKDDTPVFGKRALHNLAETSELEGDALAQQIADELVAMLDLHYGGGLEMVTFRPGTERSVSDFMEAWRNGEMLPPAEIPIDLAGSMTSYAVDRLDNISADVTEELNDVANGEDDAEANGQDESFDHPDEVEAVEGLTDGGLNDGVKVDAAKTVRT